MSTWMTKMQKPEIVDTPAETNDWVEFPERMVEIKERFLRVIESMPSEERERFLLGSFDAEA